MSHKVGIFHIGPPKTATTWVFHCLREHPDIRTSDKDRIHYFDIHYARGQDWYLRQFTHNPEGTKLFDPTYSYVCSIRACQRIAEYNPDAKIIFCLRDPIERAFSHYWHLKKQGETSSEFRDVLTHYNHFSTWMEHGFLSEGIKVLLEGGIKRENLLPILYEDLSNNPEATYKTIAGFFDIDADYKPSALYKKVNVAGARKTLKDRTMNKIFGKTGIKALSGKAEYLAGVPRDVRKELSLLCQIEIEAMEKLLGLDLTHWKETQ